MFIHHCRSGESSDQWVVQDKQVCGVDLMLGSVASGGVVNEPRKMEKGRDTTSRIRRPDPFLQKPSSTRTTEFHATTASWSSRFHTALSPALWSTRSAASSGTNSRCCHRLELAQLPDGFFHVRGGLFRLNLNWLKVSTGNVQRQARPDAMRWPRLPVREPKAHRSGLDRGRV